MIVMSVWKQNHTATEEKTEAGNIWKQRNTENILIYQRYVMGKTEK
jgi:hypothetical protein